MFETSHEIMMQRLVFIYNSKARFTHTALAENRVSGKRQDPGMSHRKLQAFAERVSGNFLRLKPQAAELK